MKPRSPHLEQTMTEEYYCNVLESGVFPKIEGSLRDGDHFVGRRTWLDRTPLSTIKVFWRLKTSMRLRGSLAAQTSSRLKYT